MKNVTHSSYIHSIAEFERDVNALLHSVIMMLTLDICSHFIVSELKQII